LSTPSEPPNERQRALRRRARRAFEQRCERTQQCRMALVGEQGVKLLRARALSAQVQLAAGLADVLGRDSLRVGAEILGVDVEVANVAERAQAKAEVLAELLRFVRQHAANNRSAMRNRRVAIRI
jgi:hypothetical protein